MSKSKQKPKAIPIHPCLVLFNDPAKGLVCMLNNNEFETPGVWGIVLADVVQHVVNAYVKDGMSAREVRADVIQMLTAELDRPTAKAERVEPEWRDQGFTINRDAQDQDDEFEEDDA